MVVKTVERAKKNEPNELLTVGIVPPLAQPGVPDGDAAERGNARLVDAIYPLFDLLLRHWAGLAGPAPYRRRLRVMVAVTR